MSAAVLTTKLYIPLPRPQLVLRPRLLKRLNDGLRSKLTLISAPAGFGKTTLVSEWIASCQRPVAWLSLDEDDGDTTRFFTYFIAALQTIAPNIGKDLASALQTVPSPPVEWLLTALLNDINTITDDFTIVLDDYHLIDAKPVDHALTFMLEHLPAHMHMVITTREDPNLPLARWRARDQLSELRATDLRFTPAETTELLNRAMKLDLSSHDVAALESRTEGWIAGLQLAVLSMQHHHDVSAFIQTFAGDHRYIVDYLVEEVLQRQPEPVRNFLLQTAIVERLNGDLCEAVTGQSDGGARLEALQRGNFFVVPLDDARHWYRYHHLFAEVLRMHLLAEQSELVPTLHLRASAWFERYGSPADAIRHAFDGRDLERVANLIERAIPTLRRNRQEATLLDWLERLPDDLLRRRPALLVHQAGALLASGTLEGVETKLRDAERWLDSRADVSERPPAPSEQIVVVDESAFRSLPGLIANFRAAHALALGNTLETVKYAQQALDLLPEDDHLGRGAAAGLLGLTHWTSGHLEAAHQSYSDCFARLQRAGHTTDAIGITIALADVRAVQGRLRKATELYERGLQLATAPGATLLRGAADMHIGLCELERERNNLSNATQHLLSSQALGEFSGLPQHPHRWRVAAARIRESQGDLDGALELLREAERVYVSDFFPTVRPIAALKSRLWVAQGRLDEALAWARERNLCANDDLSYLREFEHITLARILFAQSNGEREHPAMLEALQLLERLLNAARAGGRMGSVIELLILQALALHAQRDLPAALGAVGRALKLAEPQGFVRVFLDEGAPMVRLLRAAAQRKIAPSYTARLLAEFAAEQHTSTGESTLRDGWRQPASASPPALETLSQRELQVLRLFNSDLSGPEIAQQLEIALSTLRTHTKSIFSKLDVNSRRASVKRAAELNLT